MLLALSMFSCSEAELLGPQLLEGRWQLSIVERQGELPELVEGTIVMDINENREIHIQLSGCNQCKGSVAAEPSGGIDFPQLACTRLNCDTPLDDLFLEILTAANRYQLSAEGLMLRGSEGSLTLRRETS